MSLLSCEKLTIAFGGETILNGVDLRVEKGDRIGLMGRNGSGKSTLLKIMGGQLLADEGRVQFDSSVRITSLDQELPDQDERSVYQVVAEGLGSLGELIAEYHDLTEQMTADPTPGLESAIERLHNQLDAQGAWVTQNRVDSILDRMGLPPNRQMGEFSGGWLRRVALARALVSEPDLLLLDEPTNHMDIPSIQWLEALLLEFTGAVVFVSHDRRLMDRVATSIAALDRGRLTHWPVGYRKFLVIMDQEKIVEDRQIAELDRKLDQEEKWIRQGIKARRTRNEGRVRVLEKMRRERSDRRQASGRVKMAVDSRETSGNLVKELIGISFSHGDEPIIVDFDLTIMRGDRIGILGPNGAGKSTLLKLVLGELHPDQGQVKSGTRLKVVYFDQLRARLDPESSVRDNIGDGRDFIEINGRLQHVIGYLESFLFSRSRCQTPVKVLSGGETNRLLLAILFSHPANLLVLDEPTNDLDVEALEMLEELLLKFKGTVLLVTHDRTFLDNVVTSLLVFEPGEKDYYRISESAGGYSDWLHRSGGFQVNPGNRLLSRFHGSPAENKSTEPDPGGRKRDYQKVRAQRSEQKRLQKELELMPDKIEQIEAQIDKLQAIMSESGFYGSQIQQTTLAEYEQLKQQLDDLYQRWNQLEQS